MWLLPTKLQFLRFFEKICHWALLSDLSNSQKSHYVLTLVNIGKLMAKVLMAVTVAVLALAPWAA